MTAVPIYSALCKHLQLYYFVLFTAETTYMDFSCMQQNPLESLITLYVWQRSKGEVFFVLILTQNQKIRRLSKHPGHTKQ